VVNKHKMLTDIGKWS